MRNLPFPVATSVSRALEIVAKRVVLRAHREDEKRCALLSAFIYWAYQKGLSASNGD